jgi:hypothetical protein
MARRLATPAGRQDLWFSEQSIKYVILLRWTKILNNKVKGYAEFWYNAAGAMLLVQLSYSTAR